MLTRAEGILLRDVHDEVRRLVDDYSRLFCPAQLFIEIFDLLKLVPVVLTLWAVRNVNVCGNFVRDKAAGGRVGNSSKVIKGVVLESVHVIIWTDSSSSSNVF